MTLTILKLAGHIFYGRVWVENEIWSDLYEWAGTKLYLMWNMHEMQYVFVGFIWQDWISIADVKWLESIFEGFIFIARKQFCSDPCNCAESPLDFLNLDIAEFNGGQVDTVRHL